MKRKLLILCILFTVSLAGNPHRDKRLIIEYEPPYSPFNALSIAVGMVESKGNPMAYNAKEQATGIYQIRPCKLQDFNQATRKSYTLTEMYDTIKAKEVFLWHCQQYNVNDIERIARRWNGSGVLTDSYWEAVKKQLEME